jgi:hypothetical protein
MTDEKRVMLMEDLDSAMATLRSVQARLSWEGIDEWKTSYNILIGTLQADYPEVYRDVMNKLHFREKQNP